jgi:hypothetical protein
MTNRQYRDSEVGFDYAPTLIGIVSILPVMHDLANTLIVATAPPWRSRAYGNPLPIGTMPSPDEVASAHTYTAISWFAYGHCFREGPLQLRGILFGSAPLGLLGIIG